MTAVRGRSLSSRLILGLVAVALSVAPGSAVAPRAAASGEGWQTARMTIADVIPPVSLALDEGRPSVVFMTEGRGEPRLSYAECDSQCSERSSWRHGPVGSGFEGVAALSLAVNASGGRHLLVESRTARYGGVLSYRMCSGDCVGFCDEPQSGDSYCQGGSWSRAGIGATADPSQAALALDAGGRPRVVFVADGTLHFASCDRNCDHVQHEGDGGVPGWTEVALPSPYVDDGTPPAAPQLTYRGARPSLAYTVPAGDGEALVYAQCDQYCLAADSWRHTVVARDAARASLIADGDRIHIAYAKPRTIEGESQLEEDRTEYAPAYTSCDSHCAEPSGWGSAVRVGGYTLADDVNLGLVDRRPRVLFVDGRDNTLRLSACGGACDSPSSWNERSLGANPGGSAARVLDGERPTVAFVGAGEDAELHVTMCDATCGASGSPPQAPSGPVASTSTYPPTPAAGGEPATQPSTPTETPDRSEDTHASVRVIPNSEAEGTPGSTVVKEEFRLVGPDRRVVPADDRPGTAAPPPDRDGFLRLPLSDRGATVAAALAMLTFVALGMLIYWRFTRPLAAWHRTGRTPRAKPTTKGLRDRPTRGGAAAGGGRGGDAPAQVEAAVDGKDSTV